MVVLRYKAGAGAALAVRHRATGRAHAGSQLGALHRLPLRLDGGRRSASRWRWSACWWSSPRAGWCASSCPGSASALTINIGLRRRRRSAWSASPSPSQAWMIYAIIVPYVLGWGLTAPAVQSLITARGAAQRAGHPAGRHLERPDRHRHHRPADRRLRLRLFHRPGDPFHLPGAAFLLGAILFVIGLIVALRWRARAGSGHWRPD